MLTLAAAFLSSALAEVPDCDPDASKLPRGEHHLAMVGPDGALRYRERVTLTDAPEGLIADGEEEVLILGQRMVTTWTARVGPRMELLSTTRTEPDRVAPLDDMFDAVPRGSAGLIALAGSALPVGTLCRWSTPTFDQAHPWNDVILSVGPAQVGDVRVRLDPESGAVRAIDVHRFGQAPLSETMLAQLRVCADATCAELVKPAPVADAPVLGGVVAGDLPAVAPNVHPTAVTWVRPVRPKFPPSQIGLNLPEVKCLVELFVTDRGAVHVGHFLECPEPFRASVLTAAREAKARPVLVDGAPTQVRTKLMIRFVEE
jgi:hypothetical protein